MVKGLPDGAYFPSVFIGDAQEADPARLEREMVQLAADLVREHPEVGAIVSECTNFVPFSGTIREAARLPVFDLHTLVMQVYYATVGTHFRGFL